MQKNKILYTAGIIIVVVVLFFVLSKYVSFTPSAGTGLETIQINPDVPGITLPLSTDPKDVAWALFQKYLGFNKAQDLDGVRSTVYKMASVCDNPKTTIDCKARMSAAYGYGSAFKKEDFTNVWSDDRQIILSTDFKIREDDEMIGRTRAIIFFVKDGSGNLKMLSFSPFKGATISKVNTSASRQELLDRLTTYTEDNDKDGISDYTEQCLGMPGETACTKTNPNLRDTDGDGYWDGVQALMK